MTVIHLDTHWGGNYHRLIMPMLRLERTHGIQLFWIQSLEELKGIDLDLVDNIIVSRKLAVSNYQAFRDMLDKHGIKLIFDNDDYWNLNEENPAKPMYDHVIGPQVKDTAKICDVIWTPSKELGKQMKKLNKKAEIVFINNAIDPDDKQWTHLRTTKHPNKRLKFGYTGLASHRADVKLIGHSFKHKFLTCVEGEGFEEILNPSKTFKAKTVWEYATAYRNIDVSLAPLEDNIFNRCKSDLKVTEAAWSGSAIIASNVIPYKEAIKHNETGILCSDKAEWREAIESMTKERARELATNLYEDLKDCPDHNIDLVNEKRLKYLL